MLIDTDSDRGVIYDAREMRVTFLNHTWIEIGSFYANTDPNDHDDRGYCIIGWSDI